MGELSGDDTEIAQFRCNVNVWRRRCCFQIDLLTGLLVKWITVVTNAYPLLLLGITCNYSGSYNDITIAVDI